MTPPSEEGSQGYDELGPRDVSAHPGARVVDVREPSEYEGELCHIPGAELVPLAQLAAVARAWDAEREVILVCRSGRRSAEAASTLVALGKKRVFNLRGGMLAYREAGLPTECGACRS